MSAVQAVLGGIPLFAPLPADELARLAEELPALEAPAGTILLHEGEVSACCYIHLEGEVEIVKAAGSAEERVLGRRSPGGILGELSLFSLEGRHTASVRALSPLRLLVMSRADFDALLQRHPSAAYQSMRLVSQRLEQTENETILELRAKNRLLTQAYEDLKAAQERLVAKEKLEREMEIARQIQRSILPAAPPRLDGYEIGVQLIPAQAVGGDFYDFIPLGGGKMGVLLGDVSDKGVPAALFVSLVFSLVRAEARRHAAPAAVLLAVNRVLMEINVSRMYVTLVYAVLEKAGGAVSLARAGHPRPFLLDAAGQPLALREQPGQPLGMLREPALDEQALVIPPGGMLALFTDGIPEAADAQDEAFGEERMLHSLQEAASLPAQTICQRLFDLAAAHIAPLPQQDDLTVLCLKRL